MIKKVSSFISNKWSELSIIKRATLVFLFCMILQKTVSIVSTPIFTRLMNTEEYGQFIIYQSWLSLIAIVVTFRLDYDVFNKGMSKYEDKNSYVSTMQILTLFFTLIGLIFYCIFHKKINVFIGLPFFIIIAIFVELFFMSSIAFWTLKERYEFKYRNIFIITILMSLLNIFIGVFVVYFADNKGIARIMSCVIIQVIFGLFFFILNICKSRKIFVGEYAKFALLFNVPLIPHYLSAYILNVADKLMIQKMVGLSQAGIYGVVYSAGLVMTMVSTALNNALIPWQYKMLNEKNFCDIRKNVNKIMIGLIFCLTLFILVAPEFMKLLASNNYYEGVYVIPSISCSILFIFLYNLVCNAEFYYDKNKFTMVISGIVAILNILLNYIFINLYGYIAAGYTTLVCYIIVAWLHIIYINRISKIKSNSFIYDPKPLLLFTMCMIFISIFSIFLYRFEIIRYLLIVVCIFVGVIFRKDILNTLKGKM